MTDPSFSLAGRRALVTGASGGLGRGIAIGLAKRGWNVALHYFSNRAEAEETAAEAAAELEILRTEILLGMALSGVTSLEELDESFIAESQPVVPPSVFSAFPLVDVDDEGY